MSYWCRAAIIPSQRLMAMTSSISTSWLDRSASGAQHPTPLIRGCSVDRRIPGPRAPPSEEGLLGRKRTIARQHSGSVVAVRQPAKDDHLQNFVLVCSGNVASPDMATVLHDADT